MTSSTLAAAPPAVLWLRPVPRSRAAVAAVIGLLAGAGLGIDISLGAAGALVVAAFVVVALAVLVRALVPPEDRMRVAAVVGLALALRIASAAAIYLGALAIGREGFVTGDDHAYATLAWNIVRWIQGDPVRLYTPPEWNLEYYLLGTFVYLEIGLFSLFGPQPLVMELFNAGFASASLVVLHWIVRRTFDRDAAFATLVVVAFYPSLVLWSSLNLKDALALLLIAIVLALFRRLDRGRWPLAFAGIVAALLLTESLRRYVYVGLALLLPVAAIVSRGTLRQRITSAAAAVAVTVLLLSLGTGDRLTSVPAQGLVAIESARNALAVGARTGFVEPRPVYASEGQTFVVSAPTAPSEVAPKPRVIVVAPGSRIVLESSGPAPTASPLEAPVVSVRAGDIIVVGAAGSTPAPAGERGELKLSTDLGNNSAEMVAVHDTTDRDTIVLTRTLMYLPKGLAYSLFAPFPWAIERSQDYLTVPEMLFWYLTLALLPFVLWRRRAAWRDWLVTALFALGVLGLLALVEGNYASLYRHRAMAIPFVVALASPGLLGTWRALAGLAAPGRRLARRAAAVRGPARG